MTQLPLAARKASRLCLALVAAAAGLAASGCAGVWDDITSRDFSLKAYFSPPDPLVVLRDSTDGDQRAKAFRALKEPKENGGSDADQEVVVKLLVTAAANERQPLCRLAAVQKLGQFKDPRATTGLIDAFYAAGSFAPDTCTAIRCSAMSELGKTHNPASVELLARVVKEPPAEGTELEKQQSLDVRIAAARALGNFSHYQAMDALVTVLRTEKDVALRDRAHESLKLATGKNLPADAQVWQQAIYETQTTDGNHRPDENGAKFKLLSWFQS
jgi:HEAT repeat protein